MVGNPANSGDRGASTRPRVVGRHPDAAGGDGDGDGDEHPDVARDDPDRYQDSAAASRARSARAIGATASGQAIAGSDSTFRDETNPDITVIVLTGGGSTRFGEDKASTRVAGATLLDHVLADIDPTVRVILVGPPPEQVSQPEPPSRPLVVTGEQDSRPEPLTGSLVVTREEPPGGGPVAGVFAGLDLVTTPVSCVIATDMPTSSAIALDLASEHADQLISSNTPFNRVQAESSEGRTGPGGPSGAAPHQSPAGPTAWAPAGSGPPSNVPEALIPLDANDHAQPPLNGPPESNVPEALIPLDDYDHAQPLCASYSTAALRRAAATLGSGHGASFRDLLKLLRVREVRLDTHDRPKLFDIDTRHDLDRSSQAIMDHVGGRISLPKTGGTNMLNDWAAAAASELDLDTAVDVEVILDVAKEAAHGVARPAAPLTTFLLGYAVARGADLQEAAAKLNALADSWPQNQD